jgi:hypothetical protein
MIGNPPSSRSQLKGLALCPPVLGLNELVLRRSCLLLVAVAGEPSSTLGTNLLYVHPRSSPSSAQGLSFKSTFKVQDFHDLPDAIRVDDVAFDPVFSRLAIASAHGVFLFNVSSTGKPNSFMPRRLTHLASTIGKLDQATVSVPPAPDVTISRVLFTDRGSVLVVSYVENHKWYELVSRYLYSI